MALSEPIQRTNVVVDTQPRTCQDHGPYIAEQLDLQPKPGDYPRVPGKFASAVVTYLDPFWTNCPTCDADRQREVDAQDAAIRTGLTERQKMMAERLRASQIPQRFSEASIWNWQHGMDQQRRVWNWAREYASQFDIAVSTGRCGVFIGAPGTGKTHLAIGLVRHINEKGGTGLYTTVMQMLGRIKDTYNKNSSETESQAIDFHARPDLLVIDEVGKQLDTNHEQAHFFGILNARYNALKPTILVSNLTRQKLIDFLGAAVVDRMREAGGALHVFDWASQRGKGGPAKDGEE